MRKKVFLLAMALATLLSFAVASAQDIELRWRTRPDNQAEADLYASIGEQVDAAWDGVTLSYEPGGTDGAGYQATLLTEIAAGTAPDVFWIPGASLATFAQEGAILNLHDLAMGMEGFDGSVFYPQQMNQLTYNPESMAMGMESGALWGLPRDASALAFYYNAELFEKAGLDDPQTLLANGEWTWETFASVVEEISGLSTSDNKIYGFGMDGWWGPQMAWLNAANGNDRNYYFNETVDGCGLDTEGTAEAMTYLNGLYAAEYGAPYGGDADAAFKAGNSAMYLNGRWATPSMLEQVEFEWNVVEMPAAPNGITSNWLFWGAYVVNVNTAHPEEAFDLITRLTSDEVQGQVSALGANFPSRTTEGALEAGAAALTDVKPDINNAAFLNAFTYALAEAPLWTANFDALSGPVGSLFSDAINGTVPPAEFGARACEAMNPFFAEASS
jgi:multiple sugar transport system substrate-binding protein